MEAASSNAPPLPYAAPGAKAVPAQPPSASLISSPRVMPSLFTASSPAVAQAPAIVMPPGLRPPPGNGPLTLSLAGGVPRLGIPTRRHIPYQRPVSYQTGYAGYYGYKNSRTYRRHNALSYRNSQYPNFQKPLYSKRYYPASSYVKKGITSSNTFQRSYRQTDDARRTNRGKVNENKIKHRIFNLISKIVANSNPKV